MLIDLKKLSIVLITAIAKTLLSPILCFNQIFKRILEMIRYTTSLFYRLLMKIQESEC